MSSVVTGQAVIQPISGTTESLIRDMWIDGGANNSPPSTYNTGPTGMAGIFLSGSTTAVTIRDCTVTNCRNNGIDLRPSIMTVNHIVQNNKIFNCTNSGIGTTGGLNNISNNQIGGCGDGMWIWTDGVNTGNDLIQGNQIWQCGVHGIVLTSSGGQAVSGHNVTGNTITACGQQATNSGAMIYLTGPGTYQNTVSSNKCYNASGQAAYPQWGVYIGNNAYANWVSGCDLYGASYASWVGSYTSKYCYGDGSGATGSNSNLVTACRIGRWDENYAHPNGAVTKGVLNM